MRDGTDTARPIIFGEVLYDCFEDGAVLGGAPFNVAWHLQGFGVAPLFVSRVGTDGLGDAVLAAMAGWGMDLTGVQRDPARPTGQVTVALSAGQPSYAIEPDQAYDHIDAAAATAAVAATRPALLYHGTLATRSPASEAALAAIRARWSPPTFVDINLRAPWWHADRLAPTLRGARWAKLNDQELAELTGGPVAPDALPEAAEGLRHEYGIDTLIVTLGAAGALLVSAGGRWRDTPPPLAAVADTVGAGDAFGAVAIIGLLRGWPAPLILDRAMAFAARLCGVRGATVGDPDFYREQMDSWER